MRRRAKVDSNQDEIVTAYRDAGWSVRSTAQLGEGFPDLVVAPPWDADYVFLVEVKRPKGKTREKQDAFAAFFPVKIVRTVGDVEIHIAEAFESRAA
jgi:hypothetical protein